MTLALYREAFEHHVESCSECLWHTLQFCHVGEKLREAWTQAAAAALVPVPSIHRSPVKA